MINEEIITQWGGAFFELALSSKEAKKYLTQSVILIDLFNKYPEILSILNSYILPFKQKVKIIEETFGDFLPYIINLFLLLSQKKYFNYVKLILKEFRKQLNNYFDIQYGTVYSVIALSEKQMSKIQKNIRFKLKDANIELVNKIDENLIGGIKIKVKNEIFDGSIKGRIDELKNILIKNKQE